MGVDMGNDMWKPDLDRLIAVLNGEMPDRIPNFEILLEDRNVTALLGRNIGSTMGASRGASESAFVTPPIDPKDFIELCYLIGQDALCLEALWAPCKYRDEKGDLHAIEAGHIDTWEKFEKIIWPDWEYDYGPKLKDVKWYVDAVKDTPLGVVMMTGTFFQYCYQFLNCFDEFCILIHEDRKLIEACLDKVAEYYIKIVELVVEAGIDILYIADDVAYKSGSFVNPDIFRELWLPRAKRIVAPAKEAGIPIMFHSCGNVAQLIPVFIDLGINCLNPIEPYSMDIREVKKEYGSTFAISGNVDIAGPLAFGTPDETYDVCKELIIDMKPGGNYIFSTCHSITNDIPPENFAAMRQALKDHGVY